MRLSPYDVLGIAQPAMLQELGGTAPAPKATHAPHGPATAPVFPRAMLRPSVLAHEAAGMHICRPKPPFEFRRLRSIWFCVPATIRPEPPIASPAVPFPAATLFRTRESVVAPSRLIPFPPQRVTTLLYSLFPLHCLKKIPSFRAASTVFSETSEAPQATRTIP